MGRIPKILPEQFADLSHHSLYIAGSTDFVDACAVAAKNLGAKDKLIHTEGYFQQGQAPKLS
jgi:CDP-4-dehydro-6-deoxyglucose reductase